MARSWRDSLGSLAVTSEQELRSVAEDISQHRATSKSLEKVGRRLTERHRQLISFQSSAPTAADLKTVSAMVRDSKSVCDTIYFRRVVRQEFELRTASISSRSLGGVRRDLSAVVQQDTLTASTIDRLCKRFGAFAHGTQKQREAELRMNKLRRLKARADVEPTPSVTVQDHQAFVPPEVEDVS